MDLIVMIWIIIIAASFNSLIKNILAEKFKQIGGLLPQGSLDIRGDPLVIPCDPASPWNQGNCAVSHNRRIG